MLVLGQYWAPVLDAAVAQLPEQAGLHEGWLSWPLIKPACSPKTAICVSSSIPTANNTANWRIFKSNSAAWVLSSVLVIWISRTLWMNFESTADPYPWWGSPRPFLLLGASVGVGVLLPADAVIRVHRVVAQDSRAAGREEQVNCGDLPPPLATADVLCSVRVMRCSFCRSWVC